jgi:hypothetical protein
MRPYAFKLERAVGKTVGRDLRELRSGVSQLTISLLFCATGVGVDDILYERVTNDVLSIEVEEL